MNWGPLDFKSSTLPNELKRYPTSAVLVVVLLNPNHYKCMYYIYQYMLETFQFIIHIYIVYSFWYMYYSMLLNVRDFRIKFISYKVYWDFPVWPIIDFVTVFSTNQTA